MRDSPMKFTFPHRFYSMGLLLLFVRRIKYRKNKRSVCLPIYNKQKMKRYFNISLSGSLSHGGSGVGRNCLSPCFTLFPLQDQGWALHLHIFSSLMNISLVPNWAGSLSPQKTFSILTLWPYTRETPYNSVVPWPWLNVLVPKSYRLCITRNRVHTVSYPPIMGCSRRHVISLRQLNKYSLLFMVWMLCYGVISVSHTSNL